MRTFYLQWIAIFLLLASAAPASGNELSRVWDSMLQAGSPPSALSTPTRRGGSLGHYSVRVKTYNPNIIAMRAPHLQAGCAGIDFFGGSLSIIKKEELVQMARSVVAAAPMYAFQLAFDQLCPDCNAIMADIAKRLEKLNDLVKGDCKQMAEGFFNLTGLEAPEKKQDSWLKRQYVEYAGGFAADQAEAQMALKQVSSETDLKDKTGAELDYNSVYQAFKESDMKDWDWFITGTGDDSARTMAQILMSFGGTVVNKVDSSIPESEGQTTTTWLHAPLTLLDLYDRPADTDGTPVTGHRVIKCTASEDDDPMCLSATIVDVSNGDALYLKPFLPSVTELLCGYPADEDSVHASIRWKVARKQPLNEKQTQLYTSLGGTLRRVLTDFAMSEADAESNCDQLAKIVAINMAKSLSNEVVNIYLSLANNPKAKELSATELQGSLHALESQLEQLNDKRDALYKEVQNHAVLIQVLKGKG